MTLHLEGCAGYRPFDPGQAGPHDAAPDLGDNRDRVGPVPGGQRALEELGQAVGGRHLERLRVERRVVAPGVEPGARQRGPVPALLRPHGDLHRLVHSFSTLARARASPSSSMGGSTLPRAASGSLSPEPVSTTTVVESLSTLPSRTRRTSSASGAQEAGSANSPSVEASWTWARRISVSLTASIRPPDSSLALVAPSQLAGLPILIAEATVLGRAQTPPVTIGAAPSAWAPTIRGSTEQRPAARYSLKPIQ